MSRAVLVAVALTLLAVPAADARRCSQLHRRDLAPAKHVKLVEIPTADGASLVGCILPRGALHQMAYRYEGEVDTDDYTLLRVRREKIMLEESAGNQYGGSSSTSVADIRTEFSYSILSACREILVGFCPGPPQQQDVIANARLNDLGETAVVYASGSEYVVVGFSAHGQRTELDRAEGTAIDAASLRLRGSTMSWTHDGEQRSFTLSR